MAKTRPPLTDEELATEERKEEARRAKLRVADRVGDQLEKMAAAGLPVEGGFAARRLREVLASGGLDAAAAAAAAMDRGEMPEGDVVQTPATPISTHINGTPIASTVNVHADDDAEQKLHKQATGLMKAAWLKFGHNAKERNFNHAWKELAFDLSQDATVYVEAGLFADFGDFIQNMQRCIAGSGSANEAEKQGEQEWQDKIAAMQKELRGE